MIAQTYTIAHALMGHLRVRLSHGIRGGQYPHSVLFRAASRAQRTSRRVNVRVQFARAPVVKGLKLIGLVESQVMKGLIT